MEYLLKLKLNRLVNIEIHQREVNGETVDCVSIPMKINGINKTKRGNIMQYFLMREAQPNPYNATHIISPHIPDKKTLKWLVDTGWRKSMYYLGVACRSKQYRKTNTAREIVPIDKAIDTD